MKVRFEGGPMEGRHSDVGDDVEELRVPAPEPFAVSDFSEFDPSIPPQGFVFHHYRRREDDPSVFAWQEA